MSALYSARLQTELLAQPSPTLACCRIAQAVTLLQLPTKESTGRRLRALLGDHARSPQTAARLGLHDHTGQRRRGLPPGMAARAAPCCILAICHGAVLAAGSLRPHGNRLRIFIDFPDVEIAVAVAGAVRRLGTPGQLHPTDNDGEQLRITDGPAMLQHLGATATLTAWHQRTTTRTATCDVTNFVHANTRRSRDAAARTTARITTALHHLNGAAPAELAHTALLRLQHPTASLPELGALSDPPVSKHVIAGRLRRLLALADVR